MAENRTSGVIVKLWPEKGFGFIKDKEGREYFFHRSGVQDPWNSLRVHQEVTFVQSGANPKGPRAERIYVQV